MVNEFESDWKNEYRKSREPDPTKITPESILGYKKTQLKSVLEEIKKMQADFTRLVERQKTNQKSASENTNMDPELSYFMLSKNISDSIDALIISERFESGREGPIFDEYKTIMDQLKSATVQMKIFEENYAEISETLGNFKKGKIWFMRYLDKIKTGTETQHASRADVEKAIEKINSIIAISKEALENSISNIHETNNEYVQLFEKLMKLKNNLEDYPKS